MKYTFVCLILVFTSLLPPTIYACADKNFHHWSTEHRYVFSDSRNHGFLLKIATGYRENKCYGRKDIKCQFKSSVTPEIPIKEMEISASCGGSSSKTVTKENVSKASANIGWTKQKNGHRTSTHRFKIDKMRIGISGKRD